MQLDVSSRHLPPGQLVNKDGYVSRRSSNGHFYCGRTLRQRSLQRSYLVEPICSSEGPGAVQCASCKALEGPRYVTVRSDAASAGAGSPEDTDMDYSGVVTPAEYETLRHFFVPPVRPPPDRPAFSYMPSTGHGRFHHPQSPPPPFNSLPPPGMAPRPRFRVPPPPHFSPRGTTARFPRGGDGSENGSNRVECRPSWVVRPIDFASNWNWLYTGGSLPISFPLHVSLVYFGVPLVLHKIILWLFVN